MNTHLDRKTVLDLVLKAGTESDAIIAVYRLVYPNWDDIAKVGDDTQSWPACNVTTWKDICRMFQELTERLNRARAYDKQVLPGGCWMNNGFTQNATLPDWCVTPAPVTLKGDTV